MFDVNGKRRNPLDCGVSTQGWLIALRLRAEASLNERGALGRRLKCTGVSGGRWRAYGRGSGAGLADPGHTRSVDEFSGLSPPRCAPGIGE